MTLTDIYTQMLDVADEDQAPVVVDRLQFLNWVVSLDRAIIGSIIVDEEDAPYVPCDCPVCEGYGVALEDFPDDEIDFSPFIRYEVFFQ
jgi:hypothetical protein